MAADDRQSILEVFREAQMQAQSNMPLAQGLMKALLPRCQDGKHFDLIVMVADKYSEFLSAGGNTAEAINVLQQNDQFCEQQGSFHAAVWLRHSRGVLVRNSGDKLNAIQILKSALDLCQQIEGQYRAAKLLKELSQLLMLKSRIIWDMSPDAAATIGINHGEEYMRALEERLSVARQSGDFADIADSLTRMAISPYSMSLPQGKKDAMVDEALALATKHGLTHLITQLQQIKALQALMPKT